MTDARYSGEGIGRLMPMFVWVDHDGLIGAIGPTMQVILNGEPAIGRAFWEVFDSHRQRGDLRPDLRQQQGAALHLHLRHDPKTTLRGLVVPAWRDDEGGALCLTLSGAAPVRAQAQLGSLVNFSFGIDLADAVRRHALTGADFAPTDLAMELLYLQEAKTAVMRELQGLNSRLEDARRAAETQALTDPLTGLANRRALELALAAAVQEMAAGGPVFSLAHVDLDRFKQVNDSLGHGAGDQVLIRVAQILREGVRRSDMAARVGGDEFVLLLRETADPSALRDFGARLIQRIEAPMALCDDAGRALPPTSVSASIGIAIPPPHAPPDPDQLLTAADAALYASKRRGRARCTVRRLRAAETGAARSKRS